MRSTHPHPPGCLFRIVCAHVSGGCVCLDVCVCVYLKPVCFRDVMHVAVSLGSLRMLLLQLEATLGVPARCCMMPCLACVVFGMLRVPWARCVGLWQTGADKLWRAHAVVQACCVRGSAACSPVIDSHRAAVSVAGGAAQPCWLLLHWHARLWLWKDGIVVATARKC